MILPVSVQKYIATNAYFYVDGKTHRGCLIDPGAEAGRLLEIIRERGFAIERILLTHGHFDHIGAAGELAQALGVPVCMHAAGRPYAERPECNLSAALPQPIRLENVTYLAEHDMIALADGSLSLELIHTPGHTEDSCLYYAAADGVAFVGDTIFAGSYGRTDLYGGDQEALLASIREKVFALPPATVLLSGHSEPTTVAAEMERPWYQ